MTRGDHERGGWANARMVMASVIPLASARGFWGRGHVLPKPPAEAGGVTRGDRERGGWAKRRMVMAGVIPLWGEGFTYWGPA